MATQEQMENMATLQRRVRETLDHLGISQNELAERLGYTAPTITSWLYGHHCCKKTLLVCAMLDKLEEEYETKGGNTVCRRKK